MSARRARHVSPRMLEHPIEGEPVDYAAKRDDRALVIGLLVVAGVALAGGATLLGIGASRRQAAVDEARRITLGVGRGGLALRF